MDWDNIVVIILWLWISRFILGAGYGIYMMYKVNSNPLSWQWQDQWVAGVPFWIGYIIGRGAKWIKRTLSGRKS